MRLRPRRWRVPAMRERSIKRRHVYTQQTASSGERDLTRTTAGETPRRGCRAHPGKGLVCLRALHRKASKARLRETPQRTPQNQLTI